MQFERTLRHMNSKPTNTHLSDELTDKWCSFCEMCRHETIRNHSEYRLVYQPMSHIFGFGVMCDTLSTGATLLLKSKFVLHDYIEAVEKYKVSVSASSSASDDTVFIQSHERVHPFDQRFDL